MHFGAIAVVDSDGTTLASVGDPGILVFLRSAAKPAQVLPLIASGAVERFRFTDREIAVMIGSHGGEPFHVQAVRSILKKTGLGEESLRCGIHSPYHRPSARALREAGTAPSAVHNNCSGKHAMMLALAMHMGAPVKSYLEESHPVQRRIRAAVEELAGLEPGEARTAIDGCSAPTFAMPLDKAALAFARLLVPAGVSAGLAAAAGRAVRAMRRHPRMVAGTARLCTALMRIRGNDLIAKIGAEGFYGMSFKRNGRGIGVALKIADGDGERARPVAAIAALRQLGAIQPEAAARLTSRFVGDILNRRGLKVGHVTTAFDLSPTRAAKPALR
jgi:L-asparaginase II